VTVLKYWTYSPAINLFNAWNEMQVWMKDSKLSFGVNGEWLFTVTDTSLSSGYAGVGFYSPPSLAGDQLWVDRAALTPLSASSMEWDADRAISEHQLELNQAADEDDSGDSDYRMAPK
jgi:hypothetical protein